MITIVIDDKTILKIHTVHNDFIFHSCNLYLFPKVLHYVISSNQTNVSSHQKVTMKRIAGITNTNHLQSIYLQSGFERRKTTVGETFYRVGWTTMKQHHLRPLVMTYMNTWISGINVLQWAKTGYPKKDVCVVNLAMWLFLESRSVELYHITSTYIALVQSPAPGANRCW